MQSEDSYTYLKEIILEKVFIPRGKERFFSATGNDDLDWIFDFRKILLQPQTLRSITDLFLKEFSGKGSYQIGGLEVAAIPIVAGMVMNLSDRGHDTTGFFIRKSRKKQGLVRMIEGELTDEAIVLVDDILNTGQSFMRQVEVLESLGKKVDTVFSVLRFRDLSYYSYLHDKGIRIVSLFSLEDFSGVIPVANLTAKKERPVPMPFAINWYFKSENPNYFYVVPKSAPTLDEKHIYFGSDSGIFWALSQKDGSTVWTHKVGFHSLGKYIFSTPVVYQDVVYFGAYDGNLYALDARTGKKKWVFMEADWIGSSPVIAQKLQLLFVGVEFGLWKKQGGLAALDSNTGEKKWEYIMPGLTHSSPAYSKKYGIVICGCNDFSVYAFNAKTGSLLWSLKTEGEIKASFAFDETRGLVCFGSFDSYLYVLNTKTGTVVHKIKTGEAIYSTPLVWKNLVYVASLDKKIYCIDLNTGGIVWNFLTSGRIFASPEIIEGKIYIGSNDARFYELDALTGKNTALMQVTERITNKIAYNKKTGRLFLPTFANEIYCLEPTLPKSETT